MMANSLTTLLPPHTQLGNCLYQLEGEGQGGYKNNYPDQSMWGKLAVDKLEFILSLFMPVCHLTSVQPGLLYSGATAYKTLQRYSWYPSLSLQADISPRNEVDNKQTINPIYH